ncbi:MAG: acyl-CoA desaturase [Chloroflexi bacterium]|nr:acyl-CoA desaturase [Chloroflexota bacterium]
MTTAQAQAPGGADYAELRRLISQSGLKPKPLYYPVKITATLAAFGLAIFLAIAFNHPAILILDAIFMGVVCGQIELIGHDAGHNQLLRKGRIVHPARWLLGNVFLGISYSWWVKKHNQHHATPNHLQEDPDVDYRMIAFFAPQAKTRPKLLRPLIAIQAYIYIFWLMLQVPNMTYYGIKHIRKGFAKYPVAEMAGIAVHFALYVFLMLQLPSWHMAVVFGVVHHVTLGLYNGMIFSPNHVGMAHISNEERSDYVREQVVTARNLVSHPVTDFCYGGLNYQIEHHLFPNMPRYQLKKIQPTVRAFCKERGISYYETGAFTSFKEVFAHLHRASAPLRP